MKLAQVCLTFAVAVCIGLILAQTALSVSTAQPIQLTVITQEAQPRFPDAVDFTLKASGFAAERATLYYRSVGSPVTSRLEGPLQGTTSALDLKVSLDLSSASIPPGAQV